LGDSKITGTSAPASKLGGFHLEVRVRDMSMVKIILFSMPARTSGGILEVSTTSSLDDLSQRICLLYPGGKQKASKELETIQKNSKESVLSACESTWF
jgi:hypothetical protein